MGKIAIGLFVLCLMLMMNSVTAAPWDSSWNCYKPITINHTYVSGEQTDFTMLIDITDSDLATKAQADGNDIVFVTSDNTAQLDHQIEGTFDSTNGHLKAWIRIPTLSNTTDTVINMYYNNSGAINTENPGGVWGVNASGIWLMDEGTGYDVSDSSGNGNDGVNNGADWVAGGLDFNGTSDYIEVSTFYPDMVTTKAYTIAYRLNTTQSTLTYNARHVWIHNGTDGFGVAPNDTGKIFIYTSGGNTLAALGEATSINDGVSHEIVAVFDQVNDVVNTYVDGILDYQVTSYDDNSLTTNAKVYIGCNGTYEGNYNGTFEYIHIYDRALSAEEVGTQYNNTNSPSTFSTVGAEQTEAASNAPNITSWSNSKTNDLSLDITINISEDVNFNATANQSNITWIWYKGEVAQSNNHDNISLYWTTTGNRDVIVNATNANGTSNNVTWIITVLPSDDYMPKLVVSSNGHYLEDTDGEPFIWIGEVLWKMVQEINRTDVEFTLDELDAPEHEYSVVYSVIIMRLSGWPENPTNVYGHQPFNGGNVPDFNSPKVVAGGDPDNPNDYWDHLDFMVRETKERGMYFVLLPQWGNAYMNGAYSTTTINASTARAYGEWLGNRYKDENHIIWMLGGDGLDPDAKGTKEIYQAQAEGILKGVTGCTTCPAYNESDPLWDDVLMLYHATSGTRSSQFFDAEDVWMDIDGTYDAYKDHFYLLTDAYNQANPRPAIEIEGGGFWAMHDKNLRQIRMLPYMHYLSGGVGPVYIDETVWDFSTGWKDKLEVSERDWVGNMKWVMSSIDWYKLVPDYEIILSDNGTGWGEIVAASSSDGDLIMVSFSKVSNGSAQIDLSYIKSHTSVRGVWICPSNRDIQDAGVYSVSDDPWFTTPTYWEDAILKLEGVASSYNDKEKETKTGGSGRGGTSHEPYANNEFKDNAVLHISKDAQISFTFDKPENDIQYVRYKALTNAGYISINVEMLKDTSTFAKESAPDIIYKNINIWVGRSGYATERNIENPVVGFKVEKKWIEDNNIEVSSIKLNRYHEDTWTALPTTKTDEDSTHLYFESQTPGFSPFAITGQKKTLIAPTLTMLPEESTEVEAPPEPTLWWKYLLTGTIILLIIAGAYLYLRKQQS